MEIVETLFGSQDPVTKRRHITQYFLCISKKNGKALALDTPIPTPTGWTTMGDIKPGDYVLGANGHPVEVLAESEVFTDHECYRVTFSNGESVIADAGHLWLTSSLRDEKTKVRTTEEIAETVSTRSDGARNHSIRMPDAVDLPHVDLPIAPYTLGAWLGDGHTHSGLLTTMDEEILEAIRSEGYAVEYRHNNGSRASTYIIQPGDRNLCPRGHDLTERRKASKPGTHAKCPQCERAWDHFHRNGTPLPPIVPRSFHEMLRESGLLGDKHIPAAYLRASKAQRLALLQGLMDTDGTVSKNGGNVAFTTKLEGLASGISELLASLGIKHSVSLKPSTIGGVVKGYYYTVLFFAYRDELPVFRLQRKLDRMRLSSGVKNSARSKSVQITSVEKVDTVPTKCICVDSDDHLFLFGRTMLPTHNSSIAGGVMLTALILNHRPSAEFMILGPTKEAADNAFKPIRDMINAEPELQDRFQIQEHIRTITDRLNKAVLKIVAADSGTVTGKKATGVFIDELHEFGTSPRAAHMLTEATGGLASRPEGFVFYCTTQSSEPPAGVFKDKLDYARRVRDGEIVDKRFLPIIYEFPQSWIDKKKHYDLKNAYVTNPNWGLSVDAAFMEQKYQEAQAAGIHAVKDFHSKHLNVQTSMALRADRWPGAEFWEQQARPGLTLDEILRRSEVVVVGVDGGGLDDLLGLTVIGRDKDTREWLTWSHAWAHPSVLERNKQYATVLQDCARAGDVTLVDRIGDDVEQVAQICMRVYDAGLLYKVGLDPAGVGAILEELGVAGLPEDMRTGVSQGWRLGSAITTTERMLAQGTLVHCGQPLMAWCVGNARVEQRSNGKLVTKQASSEGKIDPLIALYTAVELMNHNPEAAQSRDMVDFLRNPIIL
jgi:phage terminase large subunit-like protein